METKMKHFAGLFEHFMVNALFGFIVAFVVCLYIVAPASVGRYEVLLLVGAVSLKIGLKLRG